jgi:hypothetical protein
MAFFRTTVRKHDDAWPHPPRSNLSASTSFSQRFWNAAMSFSPSTRTKAS